MLDSQSNNNIVSGSQELHQEVTDLIQSASYEGETKEIDMGNLGVKVVQHGKGK